MNHLTQDQIILLRSKLLNEKRELVKELIYEESTLTQMQSYVEDAGELAFGHLEKNLMLTLSTQQRKTLKSIDTALTSMGIGNYGLCAVCQNHITYERLQILPFTDRCSSHN